MFSPFIVREVLMTFCLKITSNTVNCCIEIFPILSQGSSENGVTKENFATDVLNKSNDRRLHEINLEKIK